MGQLGSSIREIFLLHDLLRVAHQMNGLDLGLVGGSQFFTHLLKLKAPLHLIKDHTYSKMKIKINIYFYC